MKNLIWLPVVVFASAFFVGCGNNNNNKDNTNNQAAACPAGYVYTGSGCLGASGLNQTPAYQYDVGFYADNYSGTSALQIVNAGKMKDFFKWGMGVCDRAGGTNSGQASCDYYTSGSLDIIIQFPSNGVNQAITTFIAKPRVNPYFNYTVQTPSGWGLLGAALGWATGVWIPDPKYYSGVERNPLRLDNMAVSLINNSLGFSANGTGPAGSAMAGTKMTIQVNQGKQEDLTFGFTFLVGDVAAARGTMSRCKFQNCGL